MIKVPYLQITVNTDPLHTDLQLQQALRLNASRESLTSFHSAQSAAQSPQTRSPQGTSTPKNRKHARSLSYTSDLSEISGRFDDADEVDALSGDVLGGGAGTGAGEDGIMARAMMEYGHYSPVHSAKRNRGNEWSYTQSPLRAELSHDHVQDQGQGHAQNQDDDKRESFSRRWRIGRRGASHGSTLSSPRTTSSPRAAASPRAMDTGGGGAGGAGAGAGRRSRFVENMNDGISEKPPSIFLRERGEGKAGHGRSIFRFGRAIASAFNPFGWGGSTGSTGSTGGGGGGPGGSSAEERRQQQLQLQQQQDISRVQMAYEELKKSGYKGVVQHYPAQRVHPAQHPQHAPEHDIQDRSSVSGAAPTQGTKTEPGQERTRTSLQLRRTKSTSKDQDPEDRKSRKDLIRQEKLLKKVSTLEDKLERARRELRDLGGEVVEPAEIGDVEPEEDVSVPVQTGYMASTEYYPRRFVPGALPTLPSERCLEEQAGEDDAEGAGATAEEGPLQSLSPNVIRHALKDEKLDTPKSKEKSNTLKRKSPDPSALEALELNVETTPTPTPTNSRKTKLQKKGKSDSPGSVDRMQDSNSNSNNNTPKRTNSGRRRQYTSPQSSPSARRRPSPSLTRHDSRMDIDGETTDTDTDTKDLLMLSSSATDISQQHNQQLQLQNQDRSSFYLQDQHAINEDHEQGLSPSPSVSTRRSNSNRSRREYIPPVPPLPKDLAATAAKVDKRLAKELARRQSSLTMNQ